MPMNSPKFEPDLSKLYDIEEAALAARLDATRAVLSHGGEKGRALEGEVSKLLRPILPSEYGLSTGFIAYEDEEGCFRLSSQLDIIIYDALRCGPLARFETCDVFPLEAVYGYVEVKAAIDTSTIDKPPPDSLEYCVKKSAELRGMRTRRYYRPKCGTTTKSEHFSPQDMLAIRSWVFAFEAKGSISKPERLAQRLADISASPDLNPQPHMHGLFVADFGYFGTVGIEREDLSERAARRERYDIVFTTTHPLTAFKWNLLHDLGRFWRFPQNYTPDIERYGPPIDYMSQDSSPIVPTASAITQPSTEAQFSQLLDKLDKSGHETE